MPVEDDEHAVVLNPKPKGGTAQVRCSAFPEEALSVFVRRIGRRLMFYAEGWRRMSWKTPWNSLLPGLNLMLAYGGSMLVERQRRFSRSKSRTLGQSRPTK